MTGLNGLGESMWFWPLHDPAECERVFQERFRRPPPWFELVEVRELEDLASQLGTRLKMEPPSIRLEVVTQCVFARVFKREMYGYLGGEPLHEALPRLGVPISGAAWLWRERAGVAARLRVRDLLEFESVLWQDESWVIDEDADWILGGPHDCQCGWADLLRPSHDRRD